MTPFPSLRIHDCVQRRCLSLRGPDRQLHRVHLWRIPHSREEVRASDCGARSSAIPAPTNAPTKNPARFPGAGLSIDHMVLPPFELVNDPVDAFHPSHRLLNDRWESAHPTCPRRIPPSSRATCSLLLINGWALCTSIHFGYLFDLEVGARPTFPRCWQCNESGVCESEMITIEQADGIFLFIIMLSVQRNAERIFLEAADPLREGLMKRGIIELPVLLALFLQGSVMNIVNAMETNQIPQPSPGPTDPLPKPTSPSPGPPVPKLANQILLNTPEILCP